MGAQGMHRLPAEHDLFRAFREFYFHRRDPPNIVIPIPPRIAVPAMRSREDRIRGEREQRSGGEERRLRGTGGLFQNAFLSVGDESMCKNYRKTSIG